MNEEQIENKKLQINCDFRYDFKNKDRVVYNESIIKLKKKYITLEFMSMNFDKSNIDKVSKLTADYLDELNKLSIQGVEDEENINTDPDIFWDDFE
jgi:hypothetical protein